ncbi:Protein of unknown function [Cotesia congregata]|uniref:Uncharacterized protein n=1 Tax=Cotesia congregata TaxID=51543 RepID=A0A8J2MJK4_COTCN|nr:Protein of unknown function [Cotesia congregata]
MYLAALNNNKWTITYYLLVNSPPASLHSQCKDFDHRRIHTSYSAILLRTSACDHLRDTIKTSTSTPSDCKLCPWLIHRYTYIKFNSSLFLYFILFSTLFITGGIAVYKVSKKRRLNRTDKSTFIPPGVHVSSEFRFQSA